jgi:hypothetical protein
MKRPPIVRPEMFVLGFIGATATLLFAFVVLTSMTW